MFQEETAQSEINLIIANITSEVSNQGINEARWVDSLRQSNYWQGGEKNPI